VKEYTPAVLLAATWTTLGLGVILRDKISPNATLGLDLLWCLALGLFLATVYNEWKRN